MPKFNAYVITINNPEVDIHQWLDLARAHGANAAICQMEKGEEGTPHIQGWFHFENKRSFKAVKKMFPSAHLE